MNYTVADIQNLDANECADALNWASYNYTLIKNRNVLTSEDWRSLDELSALKQAATERLQTINLKTHNEHADELYESMRGEQLDDVEFGVKQMGVA
tara:strand:+ start:185 stop:472 length:288 start_codon:yes stop_codon:yes gene_type:complete